MELAELEIFRAVVAEGGVTRAAERLHRVQSNVTTRLRQLEESVGVSLFIRDRKRLVLTPAGEILLDYSERILGLVQEARHAMVPQEPRGRLRVGAMESTSASRLPGPLAAFHQRWPEVQLELTTGATKHLIDQVRSFKLDAALVAGPIPEDVFFSTPLYQEELMITVPRGHRRVKTPDDLNVETLIVFEQGCTYRSLAEQWFASGSVKDRRPLRILELGSYHAMLACIAAGIGMAFVPRSILNMHGQQNFSAYSLGKEGRITTSLICRREQQTMVFNALRTLLLTES
ncbi:LysR family transcriptional regulator [Herbaspirillum sp. meg3]|jgi:DNA-binding transcriptional LysR family regulator|uniref:LysR family transcriptional regulator n=1 Tax=Herbaspirillum sp. meg3 TaxID=2025949 RepID=UPI000B990E48|nr:LysR family transcriptional regulator [Herbaspirillum sp. meg3]ASU37582.1 LysR family transcriptional regulator [Herbaspirillum sp. meg3]